MIDDVPRADAHIHLFRTGFQHDTEPDEELRRYLGLRRSAGIEHAVVVGYEGQPSFRGNNDYVLTLARDHRWIVPLAFVDVAAPPSADELRTLRERGFAGFSLYLAGVTPGLEAWPDDSLAALAGAVISINADPPALSRIEDRLAALTETTILISHLGGPAAQIEGRVEASAATMLAPVIRLGRHDHVYVKLSGLYAIDPRFPHHGAEGAVTALLDGIGPAKLLWGSDFTPALGAVTEPELFRLPDWLDRRLEPAARSAVLGGTLTTLITAPTHRDERGTR